MECHHSFTPILDSRPRSSYPWQSYRMSLHHILLLTFQPYTLSAIWWNTIWMFCNHIECSLWPATVTSWWRLWEWFRYYWLTYSIKKDSENPPCVQHGTCFIWSSTCHTMQYTTNSTQTSMQMPILQFSRQQHSRQHSRMFRRRRKRGLPDSTSGQWTLDFWGNTWKDIMYSWAWFTTWIMSIPMPLCKLSNAFLHGQLGFKWHFRLWGLYGHIQWWRHTSIWGYTLLRDALVWFEHYIIHSTSSIIDYIELLSSLKGHCAYNLLLLFFIYLSN